MQTDRRIIEEQGICGGWKDVCVFRNLEGKDETQKWYQERKFFAVSVERVHLDLIKC